MKFALVHLSGSHRGETQYFDRSWITLGSDPVNDAVFSADGRRPVAPLHAELYEAQCAIHLRNRDPDTGTLVNNKRVTEATLRDNDIIQLGPKGPKLRFRIRPEEYAACKLVQEILQDARDVAAEAQGEGRGTIGSFVAQLAYDVRRHASRATRLIMLGLLVLLMGVTGGTLYYTYTMRQAYESHVGAMLKELESARLSQADLERRTAEERRRLSETLAAHQAETGRMAALLEEQRRRGASPEEIRALTSRLKALEAEMSSAESLIKQHGPAVCFLYIAYGFVEKGKPGIVPSALVEYTGSGFLIDDKGLIVTNRHITEPWAMDPSGTELVKTGMEPKLVTLLAYFPGRPDPHQVSLVRMSDVGDVALGRLSPAPKEIAPIPVRKPGPQGVTGEAVVLLGYPAGIEGVLARMNDQVAEALMKRPGRDLRRLVQDIADQDGIRPLATQGHIGDIVPGRIVYDAQTTGGGSGGPVFNSRGEVIAVNAATMRRFGGASFGVPIGAVLDLLP
jgi:hypothetical protein